MEQLLQTRSPSSRSTCLNHSINRSSISCLRIRSSLEWTVKISSTQRERYFSRKSKCCSLEIMSLARINSNSQISTWFSSAPQAQSSPWCLKASHNRRLIWEETHQRIVKSARDIIVRASRQTTNKTNMKENLLHGRMLKRREPRKRAIKVPQLMHFLVSKKDSFRGQAVLIETAKSIASTLQLPICRKKISLQIWQILKTATRHCMNSMLKIQTNLLLIADKSVLLRQSRKQSIWVTKT